MGYPKLDVKFDGIIRKVKNGALVPHDEYMVFLSHDDAFAEILPQYRAVCARMGADPRSMAVLDGTIDRLNAWRAGNPLRCRVPDVRVGEPVLDPDRKLKSGVQAIEHLGAEFCTLIDILRAARPNPTLTLARQTIEHAVLLMLLHIDRFESK